MLASYEIISKKCVGKLTKDITGKNGTNLIITPGRADYLKSFAIYTPCPEVKVQLWEGRKELGLREEGVESTNYSASNMKRWLRKLLHY